MKTTILELYSRSAAELDSYRARTVFVVSIIFLITSTASAILRLAAKRVSRVVLTLEDYVILVAQALTFVHFALVMLALFTASVGHHADVLPASRSANFFKLLLPLQIIYGVLLGLIKTSICLFYIRVFFTRRFRLAAYVVIGLIITWSVMTILVALIICRPLAFNWDHNIPGGQCGSQETSFIAVGVTDLLIDGAVFALPLPMIWHLQVSVGKKIALFGIFGLGISTMVLSILRIHALVTLDLDDITFTASYPLLWSFLEPAIGVTVACGPLMGPLIKISRFGKYFSQKSKSRDYNNTDRTFERMKDPGTPMELKYVRPKVTTNVSASSRQSQMAVPKSSAKHATVTFHDSESETRILRPGEMGIVVQKEWQTQHV